MKTWLRLLCLGFALSAPACFDAEPELGRIHFACSFDEDCLDGYVCRQHAEGKYCTPYTEAANLPQPEPDTTGDILPE